MSPPNQNFDRPTREHISRLVKEEHRLLAQQTIAELDHLRVKQIQAALERCWDVLREHRAPGAGALIGTAS